MITEAVQKSVARIGLVATGPLRLLGLQAIMAARTDLEVIPLSVPRALDTEGLEMVVIDSAVTEHLFELLAAFRRDRPQLRLIVMGAEKDFDYIERVIGAGAKGYLSQSASEDELRMALDVVRDGSVWAPRKVLARLLERAREDSVLRATPAPCLHQAREGGARLAGKRASQPGDRVCAGRG